MAVDALPARLAHAHYMHYAVSALGAGESALPLQIAKTKKIAFICSLLVLSLRMSPNPIHSERTNQPVRNMYECIHTNNLLLVDTVTDVIVIIIILCTTLNGHLSHVPTIFFVSEIAPNGSTRTQ